jgi:hypothetical protein
LTVQIVDLFLQIVRIVGLGQGCYGAQAGKRRQSEAFFHQFESSII